MDRKILAAAKQEAARLVKAYPAARTIIFDNWRGWRFIIGSSDSAACRNDCGACPLYGLLKAGRAGLKPSFRYARLFKASPRDKRIFGPRNFLNCRSAREYQECYLNFFAKAVRTAAEARAELKLLKGLRILYLKSGKIREGEKRFKAEIISKLTADSARIRPAYLKRAYNRAR